MKRRDRLNEEREKSEILLRTWNHDTNLPALAKDLRNKYRSSLYHEDQKQILSASVHGGNTGETNGIG